MKCGVYIQPSSRVLSESILMDRLGLMQVGSFALGDFNVQVESVSGVGNTGSGSSQVTLAEDGGRITAQWPAQNGINSIAVSDSIGSCSEDTCQLGASTLGDFTGGAALEFDQGSDPSGDCFLDPSGTVEGTVTIVNENTLRVSATYNGSVSGSCGITSGPLSVQILLTRE